MDCPKCGKEAKYIGEQKLARRVAGQLKDFGSVREYDCPQCGSFIHPDDVEKIEAFAGR